LAIEILAGLNGAIHGIKIKAGSVGQGTERLLGKEARNSEANG
jgi:hypothetical protein